MVRRLVRWLVRQLAKWPPSGSLVVTLAAMVAVTLAVRAVATATGE